MEKTNEETLSENLTTNEKRWHPNFLQTDDVATSFLSKRLKLISNPENFPEFVIVYGSDIFTVCDTFAKCEQSFILSIFQIFEHTFLIETSNATETVRLIEENEDAFNTTKNYKPEIIEKEKGVINIFCNNVSTIDIKEGRIVRVNVAPLKTSGVVRYYEKGSDYAWIRCIPRIDYDEISRTRITSQRVLNKKRGPGYAAPFALFKEKDLKSKNAIIEEKKITLSEKPFIQTSVCKWDGSYYEGEFLLVKIPVKNLQIYGISVTEEEAKILTGRLKVEGKQLKIDTPVVNEEEKEPVKKEKKQENIVYYNMGTMTDPISQKNSGIQTENAKFIPSERSRIVRTKKHGIGILLHNTGQGKAKYYAKCSKDDTSELTIDDIEEVEYDVIPSEPGFDKFNKEVFEHMEIRYQNNKTIVRCIADNKALVKIGDEFLWVDLSQCERCDENVHNSLLSKQVCEIMANMFYSKPRYITAVGERIEAQDKKFKYKDHNKNWKFYDEILREGKLQPRKDEDY